MYVGIYDIPYMDHIWILWDTLFFPLDIQITCEDRKCLNPQTHISGIQKLEVKRGCLGLSLPGARHVEVLLDPLVTW